MATRLKGLAIAAAATVMFTAGTGLAKAATIGCGTVIVESTTLTHAIKNCVGDGLIVAADNVTLDLGGRPITGTGTGTGVVVRGSNVRVSNGSVRGFEVGVSVAGEYQRRLSNVEVSVVTASDNSRAGIAAGYVAGARIERNLASHNAAWGLLIGRDYFGAVSDNTVADNGDGRVDAGGVRSREEGGVINANRVVNNNGPGMRFFDPYALEITGNLANGNAGDGIVTSQNYLGYEEVVISDNVANRNGGYGIWAQAQDFTDPPGLPTDGGGNSARLNANPVQCLNIQCARIAG